MGLNRDQYVQLLKNLLPRGPAWPRELATQLHQWLDAMAEEMARFDMRVGADLVNEADPNTTSELLLDWERVVGIPDACRETVSPTVTQRRNDILQKLQARGGQSVQFFIDLAASLGFEVTITEFRPFRVGRSRVGDPLSNGPWAFAWQVNAAENTVIYFRTGIGRVGEPLAVWGNDVLECTISRRRPAHTTVLFAYE